MKVGSARVKRKRGRPKTPVEQLKLRPMEPADSLRSTMAQYVESLAVANSPRSTLKCMACDLRQFAEWCEARALLRPADVTRPILERYQRHLFYYRKANGAPLSVSRQLVLLSEVRSYFRWATRANLLLANPAADLVLPKKPLQLPKYVMTVAEVERVLERCDVSTLIGLRNRALLEVLWATGMRRAELAGLKLWDVHWEQGTVFVRLGKGQKDRVVPISERALQWVRRYVEEVRPRYAVSPDSGVLFLCDSGEPFMDSRLTSLVGELLQGAGINAGGACHLFRHACATQMLEGGADIRFVQELLGHATLTATQVYTRVSIAKLKEVYSASHPAAKLAAPPASGEKGPGEENPAKAAELLLELEHESAAEVGAGDEG